MFAKECERPIAHGRVEPFPMPKLDGARNALETVTRLENGVSRRGIGQEPLRILEEDGPKLSRNDEWLDRIAKQRPDGVIDLRRKVARVYPFLQRDVRRKRLAQGLRQTGHFARMTRHQSIGLDVEAELSGRSFRPELGIPARRQAVVRRVDLHHWESARVEAKA